MENSNGVPEVSALADGPAKVELRVGMWIRPNPDYRWRQYTWPAKVTRISGSGFIDAVDSAGVAVSPRPYASGISPGMLQVFEVIAIGDPQ